jgi:hypothetical protein
VVHDGTTSNGPTNFGNSDVANSTTDGPHIKDPPMQVTMADPVPHCKATFF